MIFSRDLITAFIILVVLFTIATAVSIEEEANSELEICAILMPYQTKGRIRRDFFKLSSVEFCRRGVCREVKPNQIIKNCEDR